MSRGIEFDIVGNDKASGNLRQVKSALTELGDRISKMFTVTALFDRGLGLLQQAFGAFVETLKGTAALKDTAKAAGMTTDEYQRLTIAAKEAGLEQEALMKGLRIIKEFMRDARVEGSRQAQVLKALGYTQDQVTSGNIDAMDVMMKLSGAVQAANTSTEKYNVAASIFGAKTQELIPLLDGLRDALAAAADEPIISESTIERLDKADKKIDRIIRGMKMMASESTAMVTQQPVAEGIAMAVNPVLGMAVKAGNTMLDQFPDNNLGIPVTAADRAAASKLGKLGMTSTAAGAAMSNVSTAQSLGMATSIALAQQQTGYLAQIATNTTPSNGGAAIPGSTNFTDATQQALSRDMADFAATVRAGIANRPRVARPIFNNTPTPAR